MPHTVSYFFSLDHGKNYSQRIISLKTFIYCTCAQLYFQLKKLNLLRVLVRHTTCAPLRTELRAEHRGCGPEPKGQSLAPWRWGQFSFLCVRIGRSLGSGGRAGRGQLQDTSWPVLLTYHHSVYELRNVLLSHCHSLSTSLILPQVCLQLPNTC